MQCRNCEGILPGKRGFTVTRWGAFHKFRHDCVIHPVNAIFAAACFTREEGIRWLKAEGLVDDECIGAWGIDPEEVSDILERAAFRFNVDWIIALREDYENRIFDLIED